MSDKTVFGEHGVYRHGKMVAIVSHDQLFIKPPEARLDARPPATLRRRLRIAAPSRTSSLMASVANTVSSGASWCASRTKHCQRPNQRLRSELGRRRADPRSLRLPLAASPAETGTSCVSMIRFVRLMLVPHRDRGSHLIPRAFRDLVALLAPMLGRLRLG